MQVKDVMTVNVTAVAPDTAVEEIAGLLLERHISGVPVVDANNKVLGVVSEGDLMRRKEADTERRRSWWLHMLSNSRDLAADYVKTHGLRAEHVMTRPAMTVTEDTTLGEVADLLEKRRIKRLPVVRDGKLVGIVSRANLLRALATHKEKPMPAVPADDQALRQRILDQLKDQAWLTHGGPNVIVNNGAVELWGWADSQEERQALRLAVESIPGVHSVSDHIGIIAPYLRNA